MDPEPSLKDVNINEISLLIKILRGERNLTVMAREVGITLQGVRYYISAMKERGLLEDFKVTPKGYEYLSSLMKILKEFVVEGTDLIFKSSDWECISDDRIQAGELVYLRMKGGFLHASKKNMENDAQAVSVEDARIGNKLRIRDIKGIIKIDFGTVWIETIDQLNGDNFEDVRKKILKSLELEKNDYKIFVMGEGAYSILRNAVEINLFSPLSGAFDCANRGVNSKVYTTMESLNLNFEEFSALKEKFPMIKTNMTYLKI